MIVLDGWGRAENFEVSAIDRANTPFVDSLYKNYPQTWIKTSGLDVGLPEGQMGNSEVGHMNLGAGRVVYQDLVKINLAAENGDFAKERRRWKWKIFPYLSTIPFKYELPSTPRKCLNDSIL